MTPLALLSRPLPLALASVFALCIVGSAAAVHAQATPTAPLEGEPSEAQRNEARQLFEQGVAMLGQERFTEALDSFRRSRAIVERPSTVLNIAVALNRLNRARDAILAIDDFLRIADARRFANERADAQRIRTELSARLSTLTLRISPPHALVSVDGTPEDGEGADRTLALDPGSHVLTISADQHGTERFELSLEAGRRESRTVSLRSTPSGEQRATRLAVRTAVTDSTIFIDGRIAGRGRVEIDAEPGEHTVRVVADDFEPIERQIDVAEGERFALEADLQPEPEGIAETPTFWLIVGGSVAAVAGGIVLTAALLSEDEQVYMGTANFTVVALH